MIDTYIEDVEGFIDRGLHVEGEACVDFGGDFARNDFKDLLAELDEEAVKGRIDLLVYIFALHQRLEPMCW